MYEGMQHTYILTTAKLCDSEPWLAQCNLTSVAQKSPGKIPQVPQLENQKDLMKMVSILLSTGSNRNDDVFLPSEILPVRNTGAHKPVNNEHKPDQIIGHIIRTFATEKNGRRVLDGQKPKGKEFDITAESVIYKFLLPDKAEEIKDKAEAGELFVSVEVWFTAFDFLVGNKIVKRTSETASILEPKLRINGGPGFFEGQKLLRVLRKMILGGMGVVADPANPESIIKSVASFNSEVVQDIEDKIIASNVLEENLYFDESTESPEIEIVVKEDNMGDRINPEVLEEMTAVATAVHAAAEVAEAPNESIESPEAQATDTVVEEQAVASVTDSPEMKALAARLEALERDNKDLKAKNVQTEQRAEASRRESRLISAGVNDSGEIQDQLAICFHMTKEQFDHYADGIISMFKSRFVNKTTASATTAVEETQTVQGGDNVSTEIVSEVTTDVVAETTVEETTAEPADLSDEGTNVEDLEVEIDVVDPELNTQTNAPAPRDATDVAQDILMQFLVPKNKKWEKLKTQ